MTRRDVIHPARALTALTILLGLCTAWGPSGVAVLAKQQQGTEQLTLYLDSEPQTLDPHKSASAPDITIEQLLFRALFVFDEAGNPVPALAAAVPTVASGGVSPDGLSYTIALKPGQQFSDGAPLTARDVVYSIKRMLDPRTASPYAGFYYDITGAQAFSAAPRTTAPDTLQQLRDAVGVEALDDLTIHFARTNAAGPSGGSFLSRLALWATAPVEQAVVEANDDHWTDPGVLIGNGPFLLSERVPGDHLTLAANPRYTLTPRPIIQTVVLRTDSSDPIEEYLAGRVDVLRVSGTVAAQVLADPAFRGQVYREPQPFTTGLHFNTAAAPFDRPGVRRAFAQAIDRTTYVHLFRADIGRPGATWLPPGLAGYDVANEQVLAFDPAAAQKALADAGYPNGQGFPADVKLTTSNFDEFAFLAAQLQTNLNVTIQRDQVSGREKTDRYNSKRYQMMVFGWHGDYPDADDWLIDLFGSAGLSNVFNYKSASFDAAMRQAVTEPDPDKRAGLWSAAERIMLADAPVVPFYHPELVTLAQPWVFGLRGGAADEEWFGDHAFEEIYVDRTMQ